MLRPMGSKRLQGPLTLPLPLPLPLTLTLTLALTLTFALTLAPPLLRDPIPNVAPSSLTLP